MPEIGQIVRVYKAGETEAYAGIVTSLLPGPGPTICVLPKFSMTGYYGVDISASVVVLSNVQPAAGGVGWEPIA